MLIYPCQMYSFLQGTVPTLAQVLRPRVPPPPQPPDTTVHIAVEEPGMSATDQVHSILYIKENKETLKQTKKTP